MNSLSAEQQIAYATACGTSVNYIRKAICKQKRFDGALARLLDENPGGLVKKKLLLPDIWPELL